MAIAYESVAETTFGGNLSLVIAKPAGLTVGDYMFAQVISVSGITWTAPAGWTELYQNTGASNLGGSPTPCAVFYKQAESADVAASNFTFSLGDAGGVVEQTSGNIIRVSGFGALDGSVSQKFDPISSSPHTFATSIDPVFVNGLSIWWSFAGDNVNVNPNISSPSIATDNPTWTSRSSDIRSNAAGSAQRIVFTAPREAATAFGDATITVTTNVGMINVIANLAPLVSGGATIETGTIRVVNQPFLRFGALDVDGEDPIIRKQSKTDWTNETKPSTTWTNETL